MTPTEEIYNLNYQLLQLLERESETDPDYEYENLIAECRNLRKYLLKKLEGDLVDAVCKLSFETVCEALAKNHGIPPQAVGIRPIFLKGEEH